MSVSGAKQHGNESNRLERESSLRQYLPRNFRNSSPSNSIGLPRKYKGKPPQRAGCEGFFLREFLGRGFQHFNFVRGLREKSAQLNEAFNIVNDFVDTFLTGTRKSDRTI